jgi:capsular exopolysaccharide synthesis family protein
MRKLSKRKMAKLDANESFLNQRRYILTNNSSFYVQEAYKALRTNIRFFLASEGCKKFCITSAMASEGKSITALNVAISFAQTGQRVLLIDGDMRRPIMARLLIEKASPGLSNVLAGMNTDEEVVRKQVHPNLDVIFSGEIPPNPAELLDSENMQKLLERMSKRYDYIIMDLPPIGIVADACVVANSLDGVLFLVRQNFTDRDVVARCVKQLELSGARLMGFVLNGAQNSGKNFGGQGYKYAYEAIDRNEKKRRSRK